MTGLRLGICLAPPPLMLPLSETLSQTLSTVRAPTKFATKFPTKTGADMVTPNTYSPGPHPPLAAQGRAGRTCAPKRAGVCGLRRQSAAATAFWLCGAMVDCPQPLVRGSQSGVALRLPPHSKEPWADGFLPSLKGCFVLK